MLPNPCSDNYKGGIQFNIVQCYYAEAVYCPPLTTPGNGSVTISSAGVNLLSVGSVATYSCDPGYALLGPPTRTCEDPDSNSVGTWSETMPDCEGEVLENIIIII